MLDSLWRIVVSGDGLAVILLSKGWWLFWLFWCVALSMLVVVWLLADDWAYGDAFGVSLVSVVLLILLFAAQTLLEDAKFNAILLRQILRTGNACVINRPGGLLIKERERDEQGNPVPSILVRDVHVATEDVLEAQKVLAEEGLSLDLPSCSLPSSAGS